MLLAGIGLLLYGMKMMSSGLETIAGDSLQVILKKATTNRFLAVFVGIVVTIAINSSTATTIMTVGFVNSGLLNLTQAIGITMGSNLGTTFSTQIVAMTGRGLALNSIAFTFILVGVVMNVFFKGSKVKNIGIVILGFGILFLGISTMSDSMRPLRTSPEFSAFLASFTNPFFALLAGLLVTAIIQSSSAATAMVVALLMPTMCVDTGIELMPPLEIEFRTIAFILLGINIGTCLTTIIASIPASRNSKRAALFHTIYNILGCSAFGVLLLAYPPILVWFENTFSEPKTQAAMFHTLFNVAILLMFLPFVRHMTVLLQKLIPLVENTDIMHEKKLIYLIDGKNTMTPSLSVMNAQLEVSRMGKIANENLQFALECFFEKDAAKAKKIFENEKTVDFLHQGILDVLVSITNMRLSKADAKKVGDMFVIVSHIAKIGGNAKNIAEYMLAVCENDRTFSEEAIEELKKLGTATTELIEKALNVYEKNDSSQISQIMELEEEVDQLAAEFTKNHFKRLKAKSCKPKSGVIYMDIVNDLEQSADNAENIALLTAH
jgi:phosphate:Na+ symporter